MSWLQRQEQEECRVAVALCLAGLLKLSDRDFSIATSLAEGRTRQEIADHLDRSYGLVGMAARRVRGRVPFRESRPRPIGRTLNVPTLRRAHKLRALASLLSAVLKAQP